MFGPAGAHNPNSSKHILIVEDEQIARRALVLLLSNSGYEVEAFPTAEEALDWMGQGHEPSLALIDLELPAMSGLDLVRHLHDKNPQIRSVFVTAVDLEKIEQICREQKIACVQKPVIFPELLRILETQTPH